MAETPSEVAKQSNHGSSSIAAPAGAIRKAFHLNFR
jgi:hypothetical protein